MSFSLLGKRRAISSESPNKVITTSKHSDESSSSFGFLSRTNAGQTLQTFNEQLTTRGEFISSSQKPLGMRCEVHTNVDDFDNIEHRYRFMFTTKEERAATFERHLLHVQADMCRAVGIEEDTLQPIHLPSQEVLWYCGRICCETEGKLNSMSLFLEGSYKSSRSRRVALDVSQIHSYSLFPGQIVLLEGINATGKKIVVKKVLDGVMKPPAVTPVRKQSEYHHSNLFQNGRPLEIATACGPFTTSDNLNYEPLLELLRRILAKKTDVVILVGPFVDIAQPVLSSGKISIDENEENHSATFEMVFVEKIVRDGLRTFFNVEDDLEVVPTQFVLIPSLMDGHHEFVFPQPPFGDRDRIQTEYFDEALGVLDIPFVRVDDPKRRVHLMPNPCAFRINEVLFSVCSNDILFSLSQEEISHNVDGHRLSRLAEHVLKQQSFCPLTSSSPSFPSQLDFRQSKHWSFKVTPDILILPSKLSHFTKDINGVVVVNPGSLARGSSGGSFSEIHIHPMLSQDNSTLSQPNSISKRCRVDILRI